ncbi:unnamed protein product [Acanthosepion pharaonis]|uniref:Uncharacterized protein n=1 Tax=Acanthosepion pharaonis TaxID=158019 RepID=A0A812C201_ACAPH|nr:unnamed protein product [Sepia pharaonis]
MIVIISTICCSTLAPLYSFNHLFLLLSLIQPFTTLCLFFQTVYCSLPPPLCSSNCLPLSTSSVYPNVFHSLSLPTPPLFLQLFTTLHLFCSSNCFPLSVSPYSSSPPPTVYLSPPLLFFQLFSTLCLSLLLSLPPTVYHSPPLLNSFVTSSSLFHQSIISLLLFPSLFF